MQLQHLLADRRGRAAVAEAPTGHGIRLGEAVDHNGALPHAGERGDRAVRLSIGQLGIDLVREDEHLVRPHEGSDLLKVRARHDRTGRIVGVRKHQHLGAGGDQRLKQRRRDLELVLHLRVERHGNAAHHLDQRRVTDKAGLGHDDLIARVDHGAERHVNGFTAADRDEDLILRTVAQPEPAVKIGGNACAQLRKSAVGGIVGLVFDDGIHRRIGNVIGRRKIRLPDGERDHVLASAEHIKELADAGGLDRLHLV